MGLALRGTWVRLEPLALAHVDGLVAAAGADPSVYSWSIVPQGLAAMTDYVRTALTWRDAGTAVPFVTIRAVDGSVVGSTRFFDMECWSWPRGHTRFGLKSPDVCEIGYTWLASSAIRTQINTEAKLLMLGHAFETWNVLRVCFHTDARNARSRAAIERLGARFEGILRAHRMASDFTPRESARYSIVTAEWPSVKRRLSDLLTR